MINENTPRIVTSRLILRKFMKKDINDVFLLYSDQDANEFLPVFPLKTIVEAEQYMRDFLLSCYKENAAYCYAITIKATKQVIGYVHLHDIGGSKIWDMDYAKSFGTMVISQRHAVRW